MIDNIALIVSANQYWRNLGQIKVKPNRPWFIDIDINLCKVYTTASFLHTFIDGWTPVLSRENSEWMDCMLATGVNRMEMNLPRGSWLSCTSAPKPVITLWSTLVCSYRAGRSAVRRLAQWGQVLFVPWLGRSCVHSKLSVSLWCYPGRVCKMWHSSRFSSTFCQIFWTFFLPSAQPSVCPPVLAEGQPRFKKHNGRHRLGKVSLSWLTRIFGLNLTPIPGVTRFTWLSARKQKLCRISVLKHHLNSSLRNVSPLNLSMVLF